MLSNQKNLEFQTSIFFIIGHISNKFDEKKDNYLFFPLYVEIKVSTTAASKVETLGFSSFDFGGCVVGSSFFGSSFGAIGCSILTKMWK
jgi:hypothetical protein